MDGWVGWGGWVAGCVRACVGDWVGEWNGFELKWSWSGVRVELKVLKGRSGVRDG